MKCHPYIEEILRLARENPMPPMCEQPVEVVRQQRDTAICTLMGEGVELPKVEDRSVPVDGGQITVRLYYPSLEPGLPVLVFFHGGGWVLGNLETHDGPCRKLAQMAGVCVASVDYRLAPEHKFPVGVYDCLAATRWVAQNAGQLGLDSGRLYLGGDSAGGGLVFAVALLLRDQGGPVVKKLVSAYPATDLTTYDRPSYHAYWDKVILSGQAVEFYRGQYLNAPEDAASPLASPMLADDLSGLPPSLIITAEYDVLTSEGQEMAELLKAAGVQTQYTCYPGMIHLFYGMGRLTPEENGLAETCRWLASE